MAVEMWVSYYFFAIVGCFIRRYFSEYIAMDYDNDKTLNRKRRLALFYFYFIFLYSLFMISQPGEGLFLELIFFWSAVFIFILYVFFISFLETPRRYIKRKKWK
ncbi:hypothetical protein [Gilliamella sp. WF3-4]|jgi:hypothetical protein|uniref:hypothetical protein n=1 Tax=Gilliamella sp. WF3-4 TaxID=3120255 RepID=UPI00080DB86C|nr:hypothetical protein [Gilliamella apicola]OCG14597.1 hypothetical protein A9G47_03510 [Gilliamella apicola]